MFRALLAKQKELDNTQMCIDLVVAIAKDRGPLNHEDLVDILTHPQDHLEGHAAFLREEKAKEQAAVAEQKTADAAFNEATEQQITGKPVGQVIIDDPVEDPELDNVVAGVFGGPGPDTTLDGDPV